MELLSRDGSGRLLKAAVGLVLLLALSVGTGRQSTHAAHDFPDGDGSAANPFLILTAEDLDHVRDDLNAHYVLGADIDLSSFGEWQPIGTSPNSFRGSFDGGGFKISGLTISVDDGKAYYGLFGYTDHAVLQNLHLRDVHINVEGNHTSSGVGALSGFMESTTVRNISVTGMVRSYDYTTGGIAGASLGGSLSDISSTADVSGRDIAGGLIGSVIGTTIQGSYAAGQVSGFIAGGIVGILEHATVTDSYAAGYVNATHSTGASGGLIGYVSLIAADVEVRSSYAFGKAEGGTSGGLVGAEEKISLPSLRLTDVYWNASANPGLQTIGNKTGDAEGRTADDLKKKNTFAGWDFTDVWGITEDHSTPYLLAFQPEIEIDAPAAPGTPVYSAVDGYNKVTVTGRLMDSSIGERLLLGYALKDDQGTPIISDVYDNPLATGGEQPFTIELIIEDDGGPLDLPDGDYTLEISVADTLADSAPGHRKTAAFALAVDRTPPVIHLSGGPTVILTEDDAYTEPGATAADDRDGILTGNIVIAGTVNPYVPGTYELKYSVRDSVGNEAEAVRTVVVNARHAFPGGDGSAQDPYLVLTAEDLDRVRNDLDAHYRQGADIDLSSFGEWEPIGTSWSPFTGTFDGGDFKITGLTITDDTRQHIGLFGYAANAVLQNIHLRDVHIDVTGSHTASEAGALSGGMRLTTVRNVSVTGIVRSNDNATGGIAGISSIDSISDSYSTADVSGREYTGGLIGYMYGTTMVRSYAAGHVSGEIAGGISGQVHDSVIVDSYAAGNVTGTHPAGASGGLAGIAFLEILNVEVQSSYALGKVEGGTSGGLVGKKFDTFGSSEFMLTHAYWNASANPGLQTIGNETGDAEGRALDDLKKRNTFVGWAFGGVWGITENQSTPYLLVFRPELEIDAPAVPGTPVYSAVDGYNKVTVTSRLLDPSIGELLNLRYDLKDDQGATVTQAVYGSVMATVHAQPVVIELTIGNGVPLDLPDGDYTLDISVADTVAGSDPAHRKTAVFPFAVDRTPPIIALRGDATITLAKGAAYTEPGAIATDNRDGVITGNIVITGTVDSNMPGTYKVTYRVRDSVGNEAEAVRKVVVTSPTTSNPGIWAIASSDNNRLESLKLLDGSLEIELTPPSSATTLRYTAVTAKERLTIVVKPEHQAASVTVNGEPVPDGGLEVSLETGDNVFHIAVRVENGAERTYTLTIRRTKTEAEPELPACPFEDVRGHWAEAVICDAFRRGLLQGVSDARFAPDRPVTRLELALILERLVDDVDAALPERLPFADVSDIPAWAEAAIRSAYAKGIVNGYPDGTFRPHRLVSREEMAAMLAGAGRAVKPGGAWPDEQQIGAAMRRFPDASAISPWARDYAGLAAAQGWMQGRGGGRFEPHANATRAEAAATILRLWKTLQT